MLLLIDDMIYFDNSYLFKIIMKILFEFISESTCKNYTGNFVLNLPNILRLSVLAINVWNKDLKHFLKCHPLQRMDSFSTYFDTNQRFVQQ